MELFTYVTAIKTKEEFSALMSLVEEGSLEELFIAKTRKKGVAGKDWERNQALVFSFSSQSDSKSRLDQIAPTLFLDDLDEAFFEECNGEFMLKGVIYPESEPEEEQIIQQLN